MRGHQDPNHGLVADGQHRASPRGASHAVEPMERSATHGRQRLPTGDVELVGRRVPDPQLLREPRTHLAGRQAVPGAVLQLAKCFVLLDDDRPRFHERSSGLDTSPVGTGVACHIVDVGQSVPEASDIAKGRGVQGIAGVVAVRRCQIGHAARVSDEVDDELTAYRHGRIYRAMRGNDNSGAAAI